VLEDVSRELDRRSIRIAGALPRRGRQEDKCSFVGVLNAERIVRCAMHGHIPLCFSSVLISVMISASTSAAERALARSSASWLSEAIGESAH
jgi:hypothetical protein